jgi:hypothetical protein
MSGFVRFSRVAMWPIAPVLLPLKAQRLPAANFRIILYERLVVVGPIGVCDRGSVTLVRSVDLNRLGLRMIRARVT